MSARSVIALVLTAVGALATQTTHAQSRAVERIERNGVSVLFFRGPPIGGVEARGISFASQRWNGVVLRFRFEPGVTLPELVARASAGTTQTSPAPAGRSCGATAVSWETTTPAGEMHAYDEGAGTDHRVFRYPAMIISARAVEHAGGVLVLEWEIEADRRRELLTPESRYLRFFATVFDKRNRSEARS